MTERGLRELLCNRKLTHDPTNFIRSPGEAVELQFSAIIFQKSQNKSYAVQESHWDNELIDSPDST